MASSITSFEDALGFTYIDVELQGKLPDGGPPRVRLRQLSNMKWLAIARGLPELGSVEAYERERLREMQQGPQVVQLKPQQELDKWWLPRKLVVEALVAVEICEEDPANPGVFLRKWHPAELVHSTRCAHCGAGGQVLPADPWKLSLEVFDRRPFDNVVKCANALVEDLNHGGPMAAIAADTFLEQGDGVDSTTSEGDVPVTS